MAAMIVSLSFLGVAALGGLTMAVLKFSDISIPLWLAIGHGLLAMSGLEIIIVAVAEGMTGLPLAAMAVLIGAALVGIFLFSAYLSKKELPAYVIVGHALIAVTGFVILAIGTSRLG